VTAGLKNAVMGNDVSDVTNLATATLRYSSSKSDGGARRTHHPHSAFANIVIAIATLIGGLISGSTGMLAEAAHSAANSINEIFLEAGVYRDRQPADARHPLGHGRERFLWSFMAAIASFLIGGRLSIAMAIAQLKARHPVSGGVTAWIILAVAFAADGASWLQGMRQARRQAKEYELSVWR
jgi:divalent metal cation (Fe/Co/Zn/Cd) transporter